MRTGISLCFLLHCEESAVKVKMPDGNLRCRVCGHIKEVHMQVCGDRDCACLCFLPPHGRPGLDEDAPVSSWQETCIVAVLDLILDGQEGEIHVRTDDGRECHIKVTLDPEIGYTVMGVGKA